jgi:Holliday junction resolvase
VSGKATRNKGRKGEREAKALLLDRDFTILADTSAGLATDDLIVQDHNGKVYSVEVKNTKSVNVPLYISQARKNSKKNDWMLLCKLDRSSSWLVFQKNKVPVVWHTKGGEE